MRIAERAASLPVFEHYAGHGQRGAVGNGKRGAGCAQVRGKLRRATVKEQRGPATRLTRHFNLKPAHAMADACSQRLGSGFLGGKAGGKALCGFALAQAIGLLGGGVARSRKRWPKRSMDC